MNPEFYLSDNCSLSTNGSLSAPTTEPLVGKKELVAEVADVLLLKVH